MHFPALFCTPGRHLSLFLKCFLTLYGFKTITKGFNHKVTTAHLDYANTCAQDAPRNVLGVEIYKV